MQTEGPQDEVPQPTVAGDTRAAGEQGVEANARLTGMTAALLLVALAVEGFTIWDVRGMIVLHFFVGLLLVPVTVLKLGSTGWRFWHYYRRDPAYRRKGPPHPVLRVLGPVVILATISLLGTGITLMIIGPASSSRDTILTAHQASFIIWVAAMTVHVLGHLLETFHLTKADIVPSTSREVRGGGKRKLALSVSLAIGIGLGIGSLSWNHSWKNRPFGDHRDRPAAGAVTAPGK